MDVLLMVISATLVLGFLVFIHEGGHFVAARAFGVRVSEFMLGLPGPKVGFTFKGTKFGVTAVPLGGYANVCGMTQPSLPEDVTRDVLAHCYARGAVLLDEIEERFALSEDEAYNVLEDLSDWGSLERPRKTDAANVYRTPAGNGFLSGQAHVNFDPVLLYEAERSQQYFSLPFWKRATILAAGPLVNVLFAMVAFVLVYSVFGFDLQNTQTGEVAHCTLTPLQSIQAGFQYVGAVAAAIAGLFNPITAADTVSNSTSIIGIAVMSKSALEAGFVSLLSFSALISVSLGLMNLLPIPPLDGGRLAVELVQRVSHRVIPVRVVNYLSIAGMTLFIGLFVIMANQDIQRFVFGNW